MNSSYLDIFYRMIGKKIKEARLSSKVRVTQSELGRMLGMSRTSIVNMEQGRHRVQIHTLYLFAQILNIDVASLLPKEPVDLLEYNLELSRSLKPKEKKSVEKFISSIKA